MKFVRQDVAVEDALGPEPALPAPGTAPNPLLLESVGGATTTARLANG